ncbi:MAG: indolepyruvate oxidoreductase subunit beta family protein [Burkholderiaceae bacterium]|nr:indolepyruvate oxidoreductase subunit beta family protein [Burkholderiaceae bacterium]
MTDQPVTILISALGGEGGGVLADWLVDTARHAGHAVQGTSIPGVAQRTGATTYYVEIFPRPDSELCGRRPVFGLYAVPGGLDLLVGSELMEAVRQAGNGLVSPDRTSVLVSTARTLTTIEKMQMADGRVGDAALLAALRGTAAELELLDMAALASQAGTVISAVMFGALAGWAVSSGRLPFSRADYEATIGRGGKGMAASLRGFGAAFEHIVGARAQRQAVMQVADAVVQRSSAPLAAVADLPDPVAAIAALGHARLLDYQDAAYAAQYRERLARIVAAERVAAADGAFAASAEVARWLALWMAFDDIVRVADLKSRAGRWQRVQREVKAADGELLRIYDHFKPGVPEIAALLPQRWADRLQRWDRRRIARGQEPWALPLAIPSHGVLGLLALRALAGLRGRRRRGSRHAAEQALIERWLAAVQQGLAEDAGLGLEIARCGRLVKGYGSTNERGKHNLLHVIDHLARPAAVGDATQRAKAVAAALAAALADDAGVQLDKTLVAHGAPPRPVAAQPIRWHRRRPAAAGAVPPH